MVSSARDLPHLRPPARAGEQGYGGGAYMFYPCSKTLFLGIHLLFHPAEPVMHPPTSGTKLG